MQRRDGILDTPVLIPYVVIFQGHPFLRRPLGVDRKILSGLLAQDL